jgi:hypothetical protein
MFSQTQRARTWLDRVFRCAGFLLLLTCVDILSPQTCAEEHFGFPVAAFAKAASASARDDGAAVTMASEQTHSEEGSESENPDEDCFCCCTHLLVRGHFALGTAPQDPIVTPPEWLCLLPPPPHTLYHPPRSL